MFSNLSDKLTVTLNRLRGLGHISEDNIQSSLREVRVALLEADVGLPVVRSFIDEVKQRALGQEVQANLNPGQMIVKIIHQELIALMGDSQQELNLKVQSPAIIFLVGLQGAGKTTTAAKLARFLQRKKKVALVSCDIYRPAAIEQLKTLGHQHQLPVLHSATNMHPTEIVQKAMIDSAKQGFDVLIVDSAGRLHVDDEMMKEISDIHGILSPVETLFVIDSMMGQDALQAASTFDKTLPLSGIILTKADSDARGGSALTAKYITGKPIKFIGTGEKIDDLSLFDPQRIASRILGMGDMLGLIEEATLLHDQKQVQALEKKIRKNQGFNLIDFQMQLNQMQNMGGVMNILEKLPNMRQNHQIGNQLSKQMQKSGFIIDSMTHAERLNPAMLNGSRKRRIANGSGTSVQEVNQLLKQFKQMNKMMKRFSHKKKGKHALFKAMQGGNILH